MSGRCIVVQAYGERKIICGRIKRKKLLLRIFTLLKKYCNFIIKVRYLNIYCIKIVIIPIFKVVRCCFCLLNQLSYPFQGIFILFQGRFWSILCLRLCLGMVLGYLTTLSLNTSITDTLDGRDASASFIYVTYESRLTKVKHLIHQN